MSDNNPFAALNKMVESMTEAVNKQQRQADPEPKSGPLSRVFGGVFAVCCILVTLMLTIKLAVVLFG